MSNKISQILEGADLAIKVAAAEAARQIRLHLPTPAQDQLREQARLALESRFKLELIKALPGDTMVELKGSAVGKSEQLLGSYLRDLLYFGEAFLPCHPRRGPAAPIDYDELFKKGN